MKKIGSLYILDDWPKPWEVLEYYSNAEKLLKFSTVDRADDMDNPFLGEPYDKIERYRDELEKQAILLLTASFEAIFRIDLCLRTWRRRKAREPHTESMRNKFANQDVLKGVRFEDILDAWKKELSADAKVIGNFKQVVQYRHWLAHGRYWKQSSGLTEIGAYDVSERGNAVLSTVPILPEIEYAPPA
jgi:hypothetical protein